MYMQAPPLPSTPAPNLKQALSDPEITTGVSAASPVTVVAASDSGPAIVPGGTSWGSLSGVTPATSSNPSSQDRECRPMNPRYDPFESSQYQPSPVKACATAVWGNA